MSSRAWIIALFSITTFVVASSLLVASASFKYQHPRAPGVVFEISSSGAPHLKVTPELDRAIQVKSMRHPFTIVQNASFNFGEMNPQSIGRHAFVIRNEGEAPLVLKSAGSSCKCTAADIQKPVVPPGSSSQVIVEWNTGSRSHIHYRQHVVLETNDPDRKEIRLTVSGRVATVCAAQPESLLFASLRPDMPAQKEVLIFSHIWDNFEIHDVTSSLDFLDWDVRPATDEELTAVHAASGYWLNVEVPASIPTGEFGGELHLVLKPQHSEALVPMSVAVLGNKLGRVSILGPEINGSGTIELGAVTQGEPKECRLLLRYRGREAGKMPLRVETDRPYLQARLAPRESATSGMFDLIIRVSRDAPPCNHLAASPAKLSVISASNDEPPITLNVEFAVIHPDSVSHE